MKKQPTPTTLYASAVLHAEQALAARLQQLKRMKAQLALLDACVPGLRARGVELELDLITWTEYDKTLRLTQIFGGKDWDVRCAAALQDLGFQVLSHEDQCSWSVMRLKRGRLRVTLSNLPTLAAMAAAGSLAA